MGKLEVVQIDLDGKTPNPRKQLKSFAVGGVCRLLLMGFLNRQDATISDLSPLQ